MKPIIMVRLKEATRDCHNRLEAHPRSQTLMSEQVSRESYLDTLGRSYGFYQPVETQLMAIDWESTGFNYDARRKLPRLMADFAYLDVSDMSVSSLPLCASVPKIETLAQAAGTLYVFEGATLGGQIIGRHLQAKLGLNVKRGAAFFGSYGDQVGPMWMEYMAFAARCGDTNKAQDEMIQAALETFDCFERWLSVELPEPLAVSA